MLWFWVLELMGLARGAQWGEGTGCETDLRRMEPSRIDPFKALHLNQAGSPEHLGVHLNTWGMRALNTWFGLGEGI